MFLMLADLLCLRVFFFFQAEDGIRDATVTGVQTCALPIFTAGDSRDDTGILVDATDSVGAPVGNIEVAGGVEGTPVGFTNQSGDSPELAQGLPYKGKSMRNRGVSSPMPFLLIPRSL